MRTDDAWKERGRDEDGAVEDDGGNCAVERDAQPLPCLGDLRRTTLPFREWSQSGLRCRTCRH